MQVIKNLPKDRRPILLYNKPNGAFEYAENILNPAPRRCLYDHTITTHSNTFGRR